jgi:glycosyltransferase involved in cell wall biosynthesis
MFVAAHNGARIWGGAERATARLLAGLQERGHRVLLYCNRPLVAEHAAALGVPTELMPIGGDIALPHALRFAVRLRRHRPDALIIGTYKKLFLASLGAHLAGVPRVVARVGLETDVPRSVKYRIALRRWVDAVVVNAARIQPAFAALTGFDGERVVVIPNGVRMPDRVLTRDEARAALGLPTSEKVVGAVARLDVQKRLDRLLRAVAILGNEVHCVIAGDGPERTALATLAEALGIASRVHFLGQRDDPWTVYAVMDVMVVSSDREGMSNSMLEALATGVPVVSTPVSGAEEALAPFPDGSCPGVLLRGFDEQELAAELRALLHDPVALRRMGAAARNRAASEFDFDRMLDRWVAVLAGRDRSAAFSRPAA